MVQFAPGDFAGIFDTLARFWSSIVEGTMLSAKTFIIGLMMLRSSTVPALTLTIPKILCSARFAVI